MRMATWIMVTVMSLGTIALAQGVTYDFDKSVNFNAYRSYGWVPGRQVGDALVDQRIVAAIDAQLAAKGLVKVDRAGADLKVAYHAAFDRDLQINGFGSGWGGYRFGGYRSGTARTEQILVGTLVVDLVDAATNTIVWRGVATKDIDLNAKPSKRDANITKTAAKLFKNYPPKS